MAAMFVVASGALGSFYLAGAQEQDTTDTSATENAEVTLGSMQVQSGSTLDVNGNNFGAHSDVSIYMMSAVQAELEDGTAIILQEALTAAGNESATTAEVEESAGGNFLDEASNTLRGSLGFGNSDDNHADASVTTGNDNATTGYLLIVLYVELENGTLTLESDDQDVAEGAVNADSNLVNLAAAASAYDKCSISISDGDSIVDAGEISSMAIAADSDEGYL